MKTKTFFKDFTIVALAITVFITLGVAANKMPNTLGEEISAAIIRTYN